MARILREIAVLIFVVAPIALILPPAALFPYRRRIVLVIALLLFAASLVFLFFVSKLYALAFWLLTSAFVWLAQATARLLRQPEPAANVPSARVP